MAYLFITHDLSVVRHISHDIAVMYLGQCVESGPTKEIFRNPIDPAPGCRFAPRCPHATEACRQPQSERELSEGYFVMCCRAEDLAD